MENQLAPIVLFVYNRPSHTRKTLEALSGNLLADKSTLYIYADGPKEGATELQLKNIVEVRELIREKKWCREVKIIEAEKNKGLANSVIDGVTEIVNKYEKIIVLEDDLITAKGFLKYMNDALQMYANEKRVMHITGHSFPLRGIKQDTYFLKYISPWGWGTWKNRWMFFEKDAAVLLNNLHSHKNFNLEDFNSGYGNAFYDQLIANVEKKLNTWAVKWHTSVFLEDGLCLFPKRTLILNIGFDNSGENCGNSKPYFSDISNSMPDTSMIPIEINKVALVLFRKYYEENVFDNKKNKLIKQLYGRFQSIFLGKK